MNDLPRSMETRQDLADLLRRIFPEAEGDLSPIRGGRREAERLLAAIDPSRYGGSRNHLDGAVTRLSPYIRHGVLTLAEVRDAVVARVGAQEGASAAAPAELEERGPVQGELFPAAADQGSRSRGGRRKVKQRPGGKLVQELGWRDYWQRLWRRWGDGIWSDREPLKTGHPPERYSPELPTDITEGRTGLACMDAFAADLERIGWLHNHARMWLASYVVHWRRVRWQAGARWFLRHLLDGDPASNNLSWQWVASSFGSKPYIFNRDNLERFSSGRYCRSCPRAGLGGALRPGGCPFEASYNELQRWLFDPSARPPASHQLAGADGGVTSSPVGPDVRDATTATTNAASTNVATTMAAPPPAWAGGGAPGDGPTTAEPPRSPILWIHGEALGPANPVWKRHPGRPAVFVFDRELIAGRTLTGGGEPRAPHPVSLKRLGFLHECLQELPVTLRVGEVAEEVIAFARRHGADGVVTSQAVDPRFALLLGRIAAVLPVGVLEPEPFVVLGETADRPIDLGRFSRYWKVAEAAVWALHSPRGWHDSSAPPADLPS